MLLSVIYRQIIKYWVAAIIALCSTLAFFFVTLKAQNLPVEQVDLSPAKASVQALYLKNKQKIDGKVNFDWNAPWVPLVQDLSDTSKPSVLGWFKLKWNENGLYIAVAVPEARANRLMDTGRTPDAPLELQANIDIQPTPKPGYPGQYVLRFMPLTREPDKMLYRNQGFLFNHRLGANSSLVDDGLVVWGERSLSGIKHEGLQTRWAPLSGTNGGTLDKQSQKGMSVEIFVPWKNLEGANNPVRTGVFFDIDLSLPGNRSASWTGSIQKQRGTGGRISFLSPEESFNPSLYKKHALLLHTRHNVLAAEDFIDVFYPVPGNIKGSLIFDLATNSGKSIKEFTPLTYNEPHLVRSRFWIVNLEDGAYTLRLKESNSDKVITQKPIYAAGTLINEISEKRVKLLKKKNDLRREEISWRTGQLARAGWLLNQISVAGSSDLQSVNEALKSLRKADDILTAVAEERRPQPADVNYFRPGSFSADGQRGYINFKAVNEGEAQLTIRGDRTKSWRVNPLIYGTFSEPVIFDRPIYDLLYGQLLRNPSFEWGHPTFNRTIRQYVRRYDEIDKESAREVQHGQWVPVRSIDENEVAAPWMGIGNPDGNVTFNISNVSFNTRQSQHITVKDKDDWAGVAQLTSLPVWRETKYNFKTYLRTDNKDYPQTVHLKLFHRGEVIDKAVFDNVTGRWQPFKADLTAPQSREEQNAFLVALTIEGPADIYIDQTNLFPSDTVGGGLDPQAVRQIKNLNTGWVRWPGGNYASDYHWRKGVGPLTDRKTRPNHTWIGLNSHYFGMDEYMKFTKLANLEPFITVNAGTGTPQEAARWVEYANASANTPMGALRAENGRPKPYDVKYWNIGNELWGFWQAGYCTASEYIDRYKTFTRTMHNKDTTLKFVSIGVGPFSYGTKRWTDMLIKQVDRRHDIIDFHSYVRVPEYLNLSPKKSLATLTAIPIAFEEGLMSFRNRALEVGQKDLDVVVGEYDSNTDSSMPDQWEEVGRLLTYAGFLHGFIRQGKFVMGANATEYSVFDPRAGEFGTLHPRNKLFKIYSRHAGNQPVPATLETPVMQSLVSGGSNVRPIFNMPLLDAVVLRDSTDGSVNIGLINRDLEDGQSITINLEQMNPEKKATQYLIRDAGAIQDTTDRSGQTRVHKKSIKVAKSFELKLPPHSVSLIKLYPKN